ncbi:MAG: butyrate kinase [Bacteroidales bacterium]|nr:butyrate kinase [Bacteroidales bacterium]
MKYKIDYSADSLIVVINPRTLFTKVGVYNNKNLVFLKKIKHKEDDLHKFSKLEDQTEYRTDVILKELKENDIDFEKIRVIISRGGLLQPVKSGVYLVDDKVKQDLMNSVQGTDIVNLGGLISGSMVASFPNANAFIADPVVVDEYDEIAKITGLPEIKRRSIFHALNQKYIAGRYAKSIDKEYKDLNLIVAHMGTGITVGAHKKGCVIDSNMGYDGDGPFSPVRAGSLPTGDLIRLCFSGKYTEEELLRKVSVEGGLYAHFGTYSGIEIDRRVTEGDKEATLVFEAMAYQISKTIGSMFVVLEGTVDAIIITGPLANSTWLVRKIVEKVEKIAPVSIYPGSDDIKTLALKGLAVLHGDEDVKKY